VLVLFQAGDNRFGILKSHVIKISDSAALSGPDNEAISSITFDGETMPRFDLSMLFGKGSSSLAEKNRRLLVAATREGTVALAVDKVEDAIEIDINQIFPLPPIFAEPATGCFPNVLRLQDDLIPLLDPNGIPKDINLYTLKVSGDVSADSSDTETKPPASPIGVVKVEETRAISHEQTGKADVTAGENCETPATASLPELEDNTPLPETTVDQEISLHEPLTEDLQEIPGPRTEIKASITPPEKTYPAPAIRAAGTLLVIDQQPYTSPSATKPAKEPAASNEPLPEESPEEERVQLHPPAINDEEVSIHDFSELQNTVTDIEELSFAQNSDPDLPDVPLFMEAPDEETTEEISLDGLLSELSEASAVKEEETLGLSSLEIATLGSRNEDISADLSPVETDAMDADKEIGIDITILEPENALSIPEKNPPPSGSGGFIRRFFDRRAKKRAARRRALTS
jgi:chemotaxis signal transduction protein